ncbi:hypothetical protein L3X38_011204 [Prunus dulcis]|uniref:Uncharacterized protein n=1 Tax=Prunus dulcis TaxID=3755 RepID=A0AAD4ZFH6_PRUDU|nr:hypothetical protein L3X38_011204 [Prunus dulcis]
MHFELITGFCEDMHSRADYVSPMFCEDMLSRADYMSPEFCEDMSSRVEHTLRLDDASVHQNRSVGDDFIEEMFSNRDGGSQYEGSKYEGSQFKDVEDLEDDKRPAQDVASGPNLPNRKVNALDDMSNKFGLMAEVVAGMSSQLARLVNVLSTDKDLADMQELLVVN